MRGLYAQCMETGRGFADGDVRKWCEKVAGRSFEDFFAQYVDGTEELPFVETLTKVGLRVTAPRPSKAAEEGQAETPAEKRARGRWKIEIDKRAPRGAVKMRKAMTK